MHHKTLWHFHLKHRPKELDEEVREEILTLRVWKETHYWINRTINISILLQSVLVERLPGSFSYARVKGLLVTSKTTPAPIFFSLTKINLPSSAMSENLSTTSGSVEKTMVAASFSLMSAGYLSSTSPVSEFILSCISFA